MRRFARKHSSSRLLCRALLLLLALPSRAWAHAGRAPEPHDLWRTWSVDPAVIVGLLAGTWLYLRGKRHMRARRAASSWRTACWLGGMTAVAIALLSPVDGVGQALFAVHMTQHLLLIMVAAPLLVLGEPLLPMLWALPLDARRAVGRWWRGAPALRAAWHLLTRPLVAWSLHAAAVLAWHLPRLYDAAARSVPVHVLEHLSFFLTALLFWWVLADRRARHRLGAGPATLYLFTAAMLSTLLGAAITMSRRPWYTAHWGTTTPWGFTPLEDQQLAGLLMWIPAGVVYLLALAPLLMQVLQERGSRVGTTAGSRISRN